MEAAPRWLDREEQQTWITLASVIMRLPGALDAQLQRDAAISHFEYLVISGLSMSPERTLRMSDLAVAAEGSLSRLSQVVSRLEKRGWVRRRPDPADGRYTLAILTDAGWEKVVATAPGHVEAVRQLVFDPLTRAQQRQVRDIGRRIMRAIDPNDRCLDDRPMTPDAAGPESSGLRSRARNERATREDGALTGPRHARAKRAPNIEDTP